MAGSGPQKTHTEKNASRRHSAVTGAIIYSNRWKIIQKHPEVRYTVKEMDFASRYAAELWMLRNQLGRRNLTDEQWTYTVGKMYEAQKMMNGGDRRSKNISVHQNGGLKLRHTAPRIAKELGIGEGSVQRAKEFAQSLDSAEKISPGIRGAVLSGETKKRTPPAAVRAFSGCAGPVLRISGPPHTLGGTAYSIPRLARAEQTAS